MQRKGARWRLDRLSIRVYSLKQQRLVSASIFANCFTASILTLCSRLLITNATIMPCSGRFPNAMMAQCEGMFLHGCTSSDYKPLWIIWATGFAIQETWRFCGLLMYANLHQRVDAEGILMAIFPTLTVAETASRVTYREEWPKLSEVTLHSQLPYLTHKGPNSSL